MRGVKIGTLILLGVLVPSLACGQIYMANKVLINSDRSLLEGSLKYQQAEADSFVFDYEKSPGRAFLLSAVLPGAGELYAGAKWRALAFVGVEAFSWLMYFNRKNRGDDLETKYIEFADANWTLADLYQNGMDNEKVGLSAQHGSNFGSHPIYLEYEGAEYLGNTDSLDQYLPGWDGYLLSGDIQPIRTRDYYENIGKYDQFAGGWVDFLDFNSDPDTVYLSDVRDDYLTQRKNSNDALKMATNFATVIMFNHLISAFHAQIAAKNYTSEEADKVSWHVGLITDVRRRNPIRGLQLSVAF
jgi:hypothetical protein